MKTTKLTVNEITELQPTAVTYASARGTVIGGIEARGDIDQDAVENAARHYFGDFARIDNAEPCDGEECVHYVILNERKP